MPPIPLTSLQRYETPALTVAAKAFSFFGAETFYILLIATSLWNWDFRFGFMFAQLLAMSLTVGNVFKVRPTSQATCRRIP